MGTAAKTFVAGPTPVEAARRLVADCDLASATGLMVARGRLLTSGWSSARAREVLAQLAAERKGGE